MENDVVLMLERGKRDIEWFNRNIEQLKAKHDNEFVAFQDSRILAFDKDLNNLIKKLEDNKIDRSSVLIEFVSKVRAIL